MSGSWRVVILVGSGVLAALFSRQWIARPWSCDSMTQRLTAATLRAERAPSHHEIAARARRNIDELRPLIETCPAAPNLYMLLALNEQLIGRDEDAARTYLRLLQIERRPEIYGARAAVLIRLGMVDEAVEAYVTALRFAPGSHRIQHEETAERVRERLRSGE